MQKATHFHPVVICSIFLISILFTGTASAAGWVTKKHTCYADGKKVNISARVYLADSGNVYIGRIDHNFRGSGIGNKNNFNVLNYALQTVYRSRDGLPGNKWQMLTVNKWVGPVATIRSWVDVSGNDPSCHITIRR